MAGIAKIASKDFDEVNKINSAVLIGLGSALVAEVKTGQTFYAGSTTLLTGTMDTVAIVAANDNYPAGYHAGDVGGLDAIDVDLAPANIRVGATIFGKVGTFEATLVEDTVASAPSAEPCDTSGTYYAESLSIAAGADRDYATVNDTFAAGSRAVAVASLNLLVTTNPAQNSISLRCIMGGVEVAASAVFTPTNSETRVAVGTRALSGSQDCICRAHNAHGSTTAFVSFYGATAISIAPASIGVGSIKT